MKYIKANTSQNNFEIVDGKLIQKGKTPQRAARNVNFIEEDFKYRQNEIDNYLIQKQLEIILPMVKEGIHLKYIAGKINLEVDELFDWYIKGYEGDETLECFSECYWKNRMKDSVEDFQSLFDKGISEGFFLKYIIRKNVLPEYRFWKSLGLFTYTNKILSDKEQFNIYKEKVLDVKENVEKVLELIDEDDDFEVPIDEILGDIEDADIKRQVKDILTKGDDENE